MIYHLLTLFDNDKFIFIVVDYFLPRMTFIMEFFPFQLMDSAIERWFPINLDTLYTIKWVVIPI